MKMVIISIHDVSPRFMTQIETILQHFVLLPLSLLITPLWDDENQLTPRFAKILRGQEKVLHGLTHRNNKQDWGGKIAALSQRSDRELYGLSEYETADLIARGKQMFENAFDESPQGFVPPTWTQNPYSIGLLRDMDFSFTETAWRLVDLKRKVEKTNDLSQIMACKTPAVCYDYGNNRLAEWLSIAVWQRFFTYVSPDLVRISIHPSDVDNGYLPHLDKLIYLLKSKDYTFQNYEEFFKNNTYHAFNYHLHTQRGTLFTETIGEPQFANNRIGLRSPRR